VCEEEQTGFGACFFEECDDLKERFETELEGNLAKFYDERPHAFRWTCCGMAGDLDFGCDHHGTGLISLALAISARAFGETHRSFRRGLTLHFCRMGRPLPEGIFKKKSATRMGLNLPRGPDPRSYNPALAVSAATGRTMFGLQM